MSDRPVYYSMVTMLHSLSIHNQSFDKRFHEREDMVQFVLSHKERVGGLSTDRTVLGVRGGAQTRGRTDRAREVGRLGFSERRQETSSLSGSKHAEQRRKNGPKEKKSPYNENSPELRLLTAFPYITDQCWLHHTILHP